MDPMDGLDEKDTPGSSMARLVDAGQGGPVKYFYLFECSFLFHDPRRARCCWPFSQASSLRWPRACC